MNRTTIGWALAALALGGPGAPAQELRERGTFGGLNFAVECAALSPDGTVLAAGGGNTRGGDLRLWDVASGRPLGALEGSDNTLSALAFSADGRLLASGGTGPIRVWDVAARRPIAILKIGYDYVRALAFGPDGRTLVSAGSNEVRRWDVGAGRELASFRRTVQHWTPAFSPDGSLLASANYSEVDLWDVSAGRLRTIFSEHRGAVVRVAFSADGTTLASASYRSEGRTRYVGEVKLWEVSTARERVALADDLGQVQALAVSPGHETLALLHTRLPGGPVELRALDVLSGRVLFADGGRTGPLRALTFRPDGRLLVLGWSRQVVRLWEYIPPRAP
jgi:WD40 repeat protein